MTSQERPTSLVLTFRHDGMLRLELLQSWYDAFDVAVTHVDDQERIRGVLRWWIATTPSAASRRSTFPAWQEFGSGPAYRITITTRPSATARKLTHGTDAATEGFASTLAKGPADPTSRASQSFIDGVARGAGQLFRTEQRRAQKRLAGGKYLNVLHGYLEEMRAYVDVEDQQYAYDAVRTGIGAILDDEQYLTLSTDSEARGLYADLLEEQSNLYNWYMDGAKGGHEWPRKKR
ncbi:hypothetical protein FHW23_003012 [Curtobacterium pusillum]|uniref:Uncharacterized protein n=1 Tax=Curtobacterium pusillum TaxID=69373 RepID=A0AAW3TA10_9MICO|nr:hypothetical protein [Curtobacterium pusillum]MBA8991734.1 hypothetical protein [Curtobacterium pusillum]